MIDHVHDSSVFPEYKDPNGSRVLISLEDMLTAKGLSPKESSALASEIRQLDEEADILDRAC